MTYLSAKNAGFTGSFNDWVAAGRPSGGSTPPPDTPPPPETPTYTAEDYQKQLQGLGYSSGTLKSMQGIIGGLGTKTAAERLHKKKSQEALSGFSKASGAGTYYDNPFLDTSSDQIWKDIQASQEKLFSEYDEEKTDLEKQIEFMNLRDEREQKRASDQGRAAVSSATAQFAQGREGAVSTTNPLIASKFGKEVETQLETANRQLVIAKDQRAKQMKRLDKALAEGKEDLAGKISESLADVGAQIQNIQQNLANAQAQNTQTAFDFLENSPAGTFEGMTTEDIILMTGVDVGTANYMRISDAKKATIELNDPDRAYKIAQTNKMNKEAQWAGLSASQKDYMLYTDLLSSDPQAAIAFANRKGFADTPTAQEALKSQQDWDEYANDYFSENGIWPSKKGQINSDGSIENSQANGQWGGQCGYYVNEYYGTKLFKNSLTEKMQYNNSDVPVVGGAFINKYGYDLPGIGQTGHVGLVTKVYEDGSFDTQDSNRNGDETIDTSHVENPIVAGIVGFFDPSQGAPGWSPSADYQPPAIPKSVFVASTGGTYIDPTATGLGKLLTEKDAILAQMKAGNMTPSEYTKSRNKARNQGWLDEYVKIQNSPKIKPITVKDSEKYGVPAAITQYQLDEILAYREQAGFGNRQFQAYVNDTATDQSGISEHDKLVKFIQLKEQLDESKALYDKIYKVKGNFLQDWKDKSDRTIARGLTRMGADASEHLEDYNKLKSLTGDILVQYVKEISGVAVSEQEFERLKQYKPNVDMETDQLFTTTLDKMIEIYGGSMGAKVKRFGFENEEQMKNIILGLEISPSTIPEISPEINDPLDLAPVSEAVDPLSIR